ncbi:3923_t:CDS:2 [Scutellospora calospora]|uniref:3923_t:CDS:1 n=1 Tax=Scutellospora calospora TaxID=85575 RepID=A0ACA9K5X5_9GLOM|nr:3923_t:CDS:2 [Scutellospora calospora]
MTVSISTGLSILKKGDYSNKCPLRVSVVGVPQESPQVIGNNENAIFGVLISDYVSQEFNFAVKESLIFVVGQLEVIENDFYIYAKNINFINIQHLFKQKGANRSGFCDSLDSGNITQFKLIATHHNIIENLKEVSDIKKFVVLNNFVNNNESGSSLDSSSKRVRIELLEESTKNFVDVEKDNLQIENVDEKYHKSNHGNKGGKNYMGQSLCSTSQLSEHSIEATNNEKE